MLTWFSVGLPALALAVLIPLYLVWETIFPAIEPLFLKAAAFNLFKYI